MGVVDNINLVSEKIISSAKRSGRNPDDIKLVAVSKTVDLRKIIDAVYAGVTILGENRVQEARDKIMDFNSQFTPPAYPSDGGGIIGRIEWHLIGNLQKNKAKTAIKFFDLIHSLDSLDLAEELNRQAGRLNKTQRILVQIKLSDEENRHGVLECDLWILLEKLSAMDYLKPEGLMTIPPFFSDPEKARPYFKRMRDIADEAKTKGFRVDELSMGMSNDYPVAIEEGATMVRVGTAIFGERDYSD